MITFESWKAYWGGSVRRTAKQERFPDGTLRLNVDPLFNIKSECINPKEYDDVYNIAWMYDGVYNIAWMYDGDEEVFTLMSLVDILRRNGYKKLSLTVPYLPNARMDRIGSCGENFSLKVIANIINSLNFERVEVHDVHSHVAEALINNVCSVFTNHWSELAKNFDVIVFPDEGACKRYSKHPGIAGKEVAFGIKKRDWSTGKILSLDVVGDNISGKRCLIVDDICSAGGTFWFTGARLLELGATSVSLYVTHCENTVKTGRLLTEESPLTAIYTTDSILTDPEVLDSQMLHLVHEYRKEDFDKYNPVALQI